MHAQQYQRVKEIFQAAQEVDAASRDSFIAGASDGDLNVQAEVEHLLRAEASSERFLETPIVDANRALDAAATGSSTLPECIGRYRIIRLLGEGGMGSVYEAEQDSPRRRVALKILRAGAMQPRMQQRFQREVEVLGRLQHPGIARIYDAGVAEESTSGGRTIRVPFFAMELIRGSPITTFAQEKGLSIRHRLMLLAEVCDAVHYGHQHGIVHRDLKPGNVLVGVSSVLEAKPARPDGTPKSLPSPKIIDFGVARVIHADQALPTLATDAGQMIGTLAYMSPEQVGADPTKVDAHSDIYALGVIGYELLTDRMPYEVADKVAPEAARIIRDEEPSRMSSISRTFRGDIETIFAKALEKDPSRRYETAAALSADIRRFLQDEPIIARPPTFRYQLVKFARRHREFVAGLALVFLVLVAGIVGTTVALFHALEQERAASLASTAAATAAANAKTEAERAQAESRKAQRVSEVVQQVLSYARPGTPGGGRDVKVVEMLDKASDELLAQLADAPEIEMTLRRTLGQTYSRLGLDDTAQRHYARALELTAQIHGPQTLETFDLGAEMAMAKQLAYRSSDEMTALAIATTLDNMLASARGMAPPAHPTIQRLLYASGRCWNRVWRCHVAYARLSELLDITQSLQPARRVFTEAEVKCRLIGPLMGLLRFEQAEALANEVLTSAYQAPASLAFDLRITCMTTLAWLVEYREQMTDAATRFREIFAMQRDSLGIDHPDTMQTVATLRDHYRRKDDLNDAMTFNALERESNERLAPDGDWLGYLHAYDGWMLSRLGHETEALPCFAQAIAHRQAARGNDFLVQEWWRAGVLANGRLHRPWASESIRRFVNRHVDTVLAAQPTSSFDLNEVRWSDGQFTLEQWDGTTVVAIASGSFEVLQNVPDPKPGLYRLRVRCPRAGSPNELVAGDWLLAAPWSLELWRAYRIANPDPQDAAGDLQGPHSRKELSALTLAATYVDPFGPVGAQTDFCIAASAPIDLPPGRYTLQAFFDDGARLWLDDQLVIDGYGPVGSHPSDYALDVEFDGQPRTLRVEYIQRGQAAALWVTARPVEIKDGVPLSPM